MIRSVPVPRTVPRMGDLIPYAADPVSMTVNAAYNWMFPPAPECYGGGASVDVATCAAANAAGEAAYAQTTPAAYTDYVEATTNPLQLLNPFTGTGALSQTNTGLPSWVWIGGGLTVAGLIALKALK